MIKCLSPMWKTEFNPQIRKIPWRRKWQPTPVLLSGKFHGGRSLVVYGISVLYIKNQTRLSDFTSLHFDNKEFMIWTTVSSQSCFCWLCRASPSLTAKNIINPISLIIREMQIKMRYHFTPVIMGILKSLKIIHAGEGVDKREPSYSICGSANWCNHYGKQYVGSSKN